MISQNSILAIDPEEGQHLSIGGGSYRIRISGEQTGGAYAVIDMLVPPGAGPGPHAHKDIQEMFYIAEGEVEFKKKDGPYLAKKGAFVNIPFGGEVHGFKNRSGAVAHLICTVVPAGLESFFKEIGKPIDAGVFLPPAPPSPEQMEKIKILGEKYGQEFYPPDYLD